MLNVRKVSNALHELKPVILMVIVQITFTAVIILFKLVAADQFSLKILVAYRFLFSTAFIVPVALYIERNKRPKLTWMILFQAFLCGLFGGSLAQNLYANCLAETSVTFASAITNLAPAVTFVMALIFRMEKLGWRTVAGAAKVLGTLMGIGGAMLLTLYKGPEINLWKSHVDLLTLVQHHHSQHEAVSQPHSGNMVLGAILGLAFLVINGLWFIIQAKMAEKYPCPYSITAMMSVMAFLQGSVYAICTEKDWSRWKLGWNIELLTVVFSGVISSGVMFSFVAWCVQMRGPLFVSVFNPLMLIVGAIAGSVLLEEQLHLGSVLGAVLIMVGLYVILWGKGKEMKKMLKVGQEGPPLPLPERDLNGSIRVEIDLTSSTKNDTATKSPVNHSVTNDEAVTNYLNVQTDEELRTN